MATIGSTSYGLIQTCYDLCGGVVAARLLTAVNRVSVAYLQRSSLRLEAAQQLPRGSRRSLLTSVSCINRYDETPRV